MKFGKQLEAYQLPEWRGQYLPYSRMKARLGELSTKSKAGVKAPRRKTLDQAWWTNIEASTKLTLSIQDPAWPSSEPPAVVWRLIIEAEARRVGTCVDRGVSGLSSQLDELDAMQAKHLKNGDVGDSSMGKRKSRKEDWDSDAESDGVESFEELRLLEALGRLKDGVCRLRSFAELNHAALYKILKKHDKLLKSKEGKEVLLPRLVKTTNLNDTKRFDHLAEQIQQAFLQLSAAKGLHASPEVIQLAAGVGSGRGDVAFSEVSPHIAADRLLFCFIGALLAFFMTIALLIALPAGDASFNMAYFLTSFPVFRLVLSVALVMWGMGVVAYVCEGAHINHQFILDIDPRCRIGPRWLFTQAAMLTFSWVATFGLYVVDYKWDVVAPLVGLETIESATGWRTSVHYVIYPALSVLATVFLLFWPSTVFRHRYRAALGRSLLRTMLAPAYVVSFGDNILGDVLTSLAKPLQDIPGAICYFFSHHPQVRRSVELFERDGDVCPSRLKLDILPLIGGGPFVFRLLQCARRYWDTRDCRHLWNLLKYAASLLVLLASTLSWSTPLIVSVSVLATAYCYIWDVALDWGLGLSELGMARPDPQPVRNKPGHVGLDEALLAEAQPKLPVEPSGPVVAFARGVSPFLAERLGPVREPRHRHFRAHWYWVAVMFDIIARCSWVLTLVPVVLLSNSLVQRELIRSLITATEILRRSVWAVLRIENEQVSNASGYRALLWVPRKLSSYGVKGGS